MNSAAMDRLAQTAGKQEIGRRTSSSGNKDLHPPKTSSSRNKDLHPPASTKVNDATKHSNTGMTKRERFELEMESEKTRLNDSAQVVEKLAIPAALCKISATIIFLQSDEWSFIMSWNSRKVVGKFGDLSRHHYPSKSAASSFFGYPCGDDIS